MRESKGAIARKSMPAATVRCRAPSVGGQKRWHEYEVEHVFPNVVLKGLERFQARMRDHRWNGLPNNGW